jgi:hypothetical protein
MDHQFMKIASGAMIADFKYLSKGKIFPVPTLSLSPLCRRMSKHLSMGEGRYNAILAFKGSKLKNFMSKKKI